MDLTKLSISQLIQLRERISAELDARQNDYLYIDLSQCTPAAKILIVIDECSTDINHIDVIITLMNRVLISNEDTRMFEIYSYEALARKRFKLGGDKIERFECAYSDLPSFGEMLAVPFSDFADQPIQYLKTMLEIKQGERSITPYEIERIPMRIVKHCTREYEFPVDDIGFGVLARDWLLDSSSSKNSGKFPVLANDSEFTFLIDRYLKLLPVDNRHPIDSHWDKLTILGLLVKWGNVDILRRASMGFDLKLHLSDFKWLLKRIRNLEIDMINWFVGQTETTKEYTVVGQELFEQALDKACSLKIFEYLHNSSCAYITIDLIARRQKPEVQDFLRKHYLVCSKSSEDDSTESS